MASRHELNLRARVVGLDPSDYANDSKLEQKVLWLEKQATEFSGTLGEGVLTADDPFTDGEVVTIGDVTYTLVDDLTEAAAEAVLTGTGNPAEGDRVTVEGQTYTFRDEPQYLYDVERHNTTLATSLSRLADEINGDGDAPAHPLVTAVADSTTVTVTAKAPGVAGNRFQTVETSSNLSWAGFGGGADAVPFEVEIGGSESDTVGNLEDAINAGHPQVTASAAGAVLTVTAKDFAVTNESVVTETDAGNASWGDNHLVDGEPAVLDVDDAAVKFSADALSGDKLTD